MEGTEKMGMNSARQASAAGTKSRGDTHMPFGRGFGPPGMMKPEKAKNARGTLGRLWAYLRRQTLTLIGVIVLVALNTGLGVLGPYLMGQAIDNFIGKGDMPGLARILQLLIGIYALASLGTWLQEYTVAGIAQRVVRDIRTDLFGRLQTLSLRYFDQHTHGEIMSRLTNDVDNISMVLSSSVTNLISSVLSLVLVATMMFIINARLALVAMIITPMIAVATRWLAKRTRQGFRDQQENLGVLNGLIEDTSPASTPDNVAPEITAFAFPS